MNATILRNPKFVRFWLVAKKTFFCIHWMMDQIRIIATLSSFLPPSLCIFPDFVLFKAMPNKHLTHQSYVQTQAKHRIQTASLIMSCWCAIIIARSLSSSCKQIDKAQQSLLTVSINIYLLVSLQYQQKRPKLLFTRCFICRSLRI